MMFPKQLMTITEMMELGFSRYELYKFAGARGCPIIRSPGGGKIKFDTTKFMDWLVEYQTRPGVTKRYS